MGRITDLIHTRQFQAGLVDGVIALAVVLACTLVRAFRRRPALAGAAFAIAGLAALTGAGPGRRALPMSGLDAALLGIGVLALLAGGLIGRFVPEPVRLLVTPPLLLPGAVLVGAAAHGHRGVSFWMSALLVIAIPVLGAVAADFDQRHARRAFGPVLLAVSMVGVYLTVPDTEGARALVGVALPLVLLTLPRARATLGVAGSAAAVGLLGFDAVVEGAARPGAIVGALGCLGLFIWEPIGRRVLVRMRERDGHGPSDHLRNVTVAVALQCAVVAWSARIAGHEHRAIAATVLLFPAAAAAVFAAPLLPDPPLPHRARSSNGFHPLRAARAARGARRGSTRRTARP